MFALWHIPSPHVSLGMGLRPNHCQLCVIVQKYLGRGPVYLVPGQRSSRKGKQRILFLVSYEAHQIILLCELLDTHLMHGFSFILLLWSIVF